MAAVIDRHHPILVHFVLDSVDGPKMYRNPLSF